MKRLLDIIFAVTHPIFWFSNSECSYYHDKWINDCITNGEKLVIKCKATAELEGKTIWIENYPYAFGSIYKGDTPEFLPYRRTRKRLMDYVKKAQHVPQVQQGRSKPKLVSKGV